MWRSEGRILTTHAGALPRSPELTRLVRAKAGNAPVDEADLAAKIRAEVASVVRRQVACGVDLVNDGEIAKSNFNNYCAERLSGFERRPYVEGKSPEGLTIASRDARKFPEYFRLEVAGFARFRKPETQIFCNGPLKYVGHAALKADLENKGKKD